MNIVIGSDHGGTSLKDALIPRLLEMGHSVEDRGGFDSTPIDYPDKAEEVARLVAGGEYELGILFCGTGAGMSIAANKVSGIRAVLCGNVFTARMAREHNNANVIALGARVTGVELAWEILKTFFAAEFQGGRHETRVKKIDGIIP